MARHELHELIPQKGEKGRKKREEKTDRDGTLGLSAAVTSVSVSRNDICGSQIKIIKIVVSGGHPTRLCIRKSRGRDEPFPDHAVEQSTE
jgi:hypothetical protein